MIAATPRSEVICSMISKPASGWRRIAAHSSGFSPLGLERTSSAMPIFSAHAYLPGDRLGEVGDPLRLGHVHIPKAEDAEQDFDDRLAVACRGGQPSLDNHPLLVRLTGYLEDGAHHDRRQSGKRRCPADGPGDDGQCAADDECEKPHQGPAALSGAPYGPVPICQCAAVLSCHVTPFPVGTV